MAGQCETKSILIVEDEYILSMAVADYLQAKGFHTFEASQASEAEAILKSQMIDLMFTDIKLDGAVDGLDLAQLARSKFPNVKVIVTSGHVKTETSISPPEAFIAKPYDFEHLCQVFQSVLHA